MGGPVGHYHWKALKHLAGMLSNWGIVYILVLGHAKGDMLAKVLNLNLIYDPCYVPLPCFGVRGLDLGARKRSLYVVLAFWHQNMVAVIAD
jgi:hypothetical protein